MAKIYIASYRWPTYDELLCAGINRDKVRKQAYRMTIKKEPELKLEQIEIHEISLV